MRKPLTIEDELAGLLERRSRKLGMSFKDVVNRTLRAGRGEEAQQRKHPVPKVIPHAFGFRPDIDLDKLNQLADELEDETYVAGQRSKPRSRQATRHDPARRKRPRSRS